MGGYQRFIPFPRVFVFFIFIGISTFSGYLMPNPSFSKDSSDNILPIHGRISKVHFFPKLICFFIFIGISTFSGYFMPNPSFSKDSSENILPIHGRISKVHTFPTSICFLYLLAYQPSRVISYQIHHFRRTVVIIFYPYIGGYQRFTRFPRVFVFYIYWHINLLGLFNAKSIIFEGQLW